MVHYGIHLAFINALALHATTAFPKFHHDLNSPRGLSDSIKPADKSSRLDIGEWRDVEEGWSVSSHEKEKDVNFFPLSDNARMTVERKPVSPQRAYIGPNLGSNLVYTKVKRGAVASSSKCKCDCKLDQGVCARGQDGKLEYFPSQCALECYECTFNKRYTLYRRGACPTETTTARGPRPTLRPFTIPPTTRRPSPTPKCTCNCPRGKVLCAVDKHGNKQTFGSECALTCYNCTFNADFRKVKNGDC